MTKYLIKNLNPKNSEKNFKKFSNIIFWILFIILGILAVVNQKFCVYNSVLLQFLVTVLLGIGSIFLLFRKTTQGLAFYQYWQESVIEIKKVTWPNKKETMQTTGAVVVMVIIMGLMLWTVDSVLIKLVAWLLRRGSGG